MTRSRPLLGVSLAVAAALVLLAPVAASAQGLEWRQQTIEGSQSGLGRIGDLEFLEPNLGLLISAGSGADVKPGVWAYNGVAWRQLSTVCGATDGRIAWAGPEEFWTVSDGRPGQAANSLGQLPPLEDNTLCRFGKRAAGGAAPLEVLTSYASLAFSASSYQSMNAAVCSSTSNCWFAGAPLPEPLQGAFQLHWDGSTVVAEPNLKAKAIGDMQLFQGELDESAVLPLKPPPGEQTIEEILHPTVLFEVGPEGAVPQFKPLRLFSATHESELLPQYAPHSSSLALEYLHLGADGESLWAAGQARREPTNAGENPGVLTVLRDTGGLWTQVLGPPTPSGENGESVQVTPSSLAADAVIAIAPEPGTTSAWLAVHGSEEADGPTAVAHVLHITAAGAIEEEEVPSRQQREAGVEGAGQASDITCPAQNDCWLATTGGALFHLSEAGSETLPVNGDPALSGPLITVRPRDEGLPLLPSDTVPANTSGENEHPPLPEVSKPEPQKFARVTVPLLSHLHARVFHRDILELRFDLAVKARVQLIAKRHSKVVGRTRKQTLSRGTHRLMLQLDPRHWPTKLQLQTHALAPLPTISTRSSSVESTTTSLVDPPALERRLLGSWR